MIRFNKNAVNNVVVTLTENSTVENPIYLFLFTNQQSNDKYYFIASDTSAFKQRFNQFQVTEKENPNTLNGEVSLGNEGMHNYSVYQTSLLNTSGLANAKAAVPFITKTVEVGIVWVVPVPTENKTYQGTNNEVIVYQNEV